MKRYPNLILAAILLCSAFLAIHDLCQVQP